MPLWQAAAALSSGTASAAAEASPSRMSMSSKRPLADRLQQPRVAGLGRAMGDQAMVERAAVGGIEHRRRGGAGITVEQHGDVAHAGGQNGAGDGRQFLAAHRRQQGERVARGDRLRVMRQRLVDDGDLVREGGALHAGAGPRPVRAAAAEQRGESVAAVVVLAMPISPRHSTSMPGSAAIMP